MVGMKAGLKLSFNTIFQDLEINRKLEMDCSFQNWMNQPPISYVIGVIIAVLREEGTEQENKWRVNNFSN